MNTMNTLVLHIFYIMLVYSQVSGSYDCVCNYRVETTVYKEADIHSDILGYMYEFDCKPQTSIYRLGWEVIEFEHQIAYVTQDDQIQVQICTGSVPPADRRTTPRASNTERIHPTNERSTSKDPLNITHVVPVTTTSKASLYTPVLDTVKSNITSSSTSTNIHRNNTTIHRNSYNTTNTTRSTLTSSYSTSLNTLNTSFSTHDSNDNVSTSTTMMPLNHLNTLSNVTDSSTLYPLSTSGINTNTPLNNLQNVTMTTTRLSNNNTVSSTSSILAVLTNATQFTPSLTTNSTRVMSSQLMANATKFTPSQTTNATRFVSTAMTNVTEFTPLQTSRVNVTIDTKYTTTDSHNIFTLTSKNSSSATVPTVSVSPTNVTTVTYNATRSGLDTQTTKVHTFTASTSIIPRTRTTTSITPTITTSQVKDRVDLCPYQFLANDYNVGNHNYPHFRQYGDFCFEIRQGSKSWSAAHDDCLARGGELVVFNDIEIEKRVHNVTMLMHYGDGVWIGLRVANTQDDRYVWVDGSVPASSTITSHSLDTPGSTSGRDCVVMVTPRTWTNVACQETHHWVCQYSIY